MIVPVIVVAVLQLADALSTAKILGRGGFEANPAMKWLLDRLGFGGLLVAKVAFVAGVAITAHQGYLPIESLYGVIAIYLWVVAHNLRELRKK